MARMETNDRSVEKKIEPTGQPLNSCEVETSERRCYSVGELRIRHVRLGTDKLAAQVATRYQLVRWEVTAWRLLHSGCFSSRYGSNLHSSLLMHSTASRLDGTKVKLQKNSG